MSESNLNQAVVAVYPTHETAEVAIRDLKMAGFDLKRLSIIGQDIREEEHVVGFYNTGERVAYWGSAGALWGGLFGFIVGTGLFFFPGVGPVFVAGPALAWVVGALEGAIVVGGLSALGAALYSAGIPKDSVVQYETDVRAGKYLLVLHGQPEEVLKAKNILDVNAQHYNLSRGDQPYDDHADDRTLTQPLARMNKVPADPEANIKMDPQPVMMTGTDVRPAQPVVTADEEVRVHPEGP
jgi:hypothetical protein